LKGCGAWNRCLVAWTRADSERRASLEDRENGSAELVVRAGPRGRGTSSWRSGFEVPTRKA